jgi:hypothetical protein
MKPGELDQPRAGPPDPGPQPDQPQRAVDQAASIAGETGGLGSPGQPVNRRSPFWMGMAAAAGVAAAVRRSLAGLAGRR